MIKFGVRVLMETLGAHMGIEGGLKKPKKLPKKHGKGENEKNEPNL